MSFLQPMLLAGAAAGRAADHHSPDQPAPLPDDSLGGDDVSAGGQPHVARLSPAAAMADHVVPHAGHRGADFRRQPAVGQRLAGAGRRRPSRHDDRPPGPFAQHAAARRRRRRIEARDRPAATGRDARTLRSSRWVLIDSATKRAARAGIAAACSNTCPRPSRASAAADLPAMLQAAHDYIRRQSDRPDRDLDLLRPARQRLERRERPLAKLCGGVPRIPARRPVSSAGLSASRSGKRSGPRDRHPASHDDRRRRVVGLAEARARRRIADDRERADAVRDRRGAFGAHRRNGRAKISS